MRVLFDQGTPARLRKHLSPHSVEAAFECGWGTLRNGELLKEAETAGFQMLVTKDQNLKYQQNLSDRMIAIVVLSTTSWPRIERVVSKVAAAVSAAHAGSYVEVRIP